MVSNIEGLKIPQWVQWKYVFILTICLMAIHVLLFQDDLATDDNLSKPSTKASKLQPAAPAPEIPNLRPPPPPPPSNFDDFRDEDKPQVNPELFVEEDPNGEFDSRLPYDGIPNDEHTAICISVKDQAEDMVEWLVHHYHHIGIRRFYIMDDGSDPPLSSYEYPGVPRSTLTFTYQDRGSRAGYMQTLFYTWCIERYRDRHTWLAFIDGDEFFETTGNETLREILESFEGDETVGALGVNWRMHTSAGLLTRPESVRKSFTTCIHDDKEHNGETTDNNHIKSIVKTKYAGPPINPHKFVTSPGTNTVGEHGDIVESAAWRKPITRERISLHHYAVKSRAEYEEKMSRGNGMTDPKGEAFWTHVENEIAHVDCPEMISYEP